MSKYAIGLDFGTNSCRSLIVNLENGEELATDVFAYPSGKDGVIIDAGNPHLARQNPADYLQGIEVTVTKALARAREKEPSFDAKDVIGIGIDTTGSSIMPVDEQGSPLCFQQRFADNPAAMVWLWKDHTSYAEAEEITAKAARLRPQYLSKIGGVYSSEWFWSKILHCRREHPQVFEATYSFVEICDYLPAVLVGDTRPDHLKRSVCAAGHKAMYNRQWGGLPDEEFLQQLDPALVDLRTRLYDAAYGAEERVGYLSPQWAQKLGISEDVAVAVGAFDAHMGAVGAGVTDGTLVKIIGTSTCDIMIWPTNRPLQDIPGVCGIVDGSVMAGYYGIEAGQSAVGDLFLWLVHHLTPDSYGKTVDEKFRNLEKSAAALKPGESGLVALDWNNGNRTILVDARLSGLLVGQTLHTESHEIYRALMEATAFGALTIIDRIESYGVPIRDVHCCGGLAVKNELMMQIYADVIGRPMKISRSEQTPALGAAIFASVAAGKEAGGFANAREAQEMITGISKTYYPNKQRHEIYTELYGLYKQLHDAFGTREWQGNLYTVMKSLLKIQNSIKKGC